MNQNEEFNKIEDVYERLENDARIQHVGDDVMSVQSKEGLESARDLVNGAILDGLVTAADLSRRTNIKPSAISAFRNKKWRGKAGTHATTASQLTKAVNQLLRQRKADETRIDGFVKTKVARAIFDLAAYAIKRRQIAVFVIPAGSGKTLALQQLQDEIPGSVLLTVTRTRSSVKAFLQAWARALGLDEIGPAQAIQDAVINRLVRSDRLVMIDECHKMQISCLDVLREVYDEARIPIILAGTPSFYQTLASRRAGTVSSELLDQLYSRVGMFRDLTDLATSNGAGNERLFSREDIKKVFARGGIRLSRDGIEFLCRLANHPGSGALRVCRDLVQIVVDLYPGETVTAALLEKAFSMKVGVKEAGFRIDQARGHVAPEEDRVVASA